MTANLRKHYTKFFGPNYRFIPANYPVNVIVQLRDLQPGQNWNPDWTAELLTPQTLIPYPDIQLWYYAGLRFTHRLQWRTLTDEYVPPKLHEHCELVVRSNLDQSLAFFFKPHWAAQLWMVNELTDPLGNYAIGGGASLSWKYVG